MNVWVTAEVTVGALDDGNRAVLAAGNALIRQALAVVGRHGASPRAAPPRARRRRPSFRARPTSPRSTSLTCPAPSGDRSRTPKVGPGISYAHDGTHHEIGLVFPPGIGG